MSMSEDQLRKQLTFAMAEAVDDVETFETYFGTPTESVDFGVARADGSMPSDMFFLWEFAGFITEYASVHGVDVIDLAEKAGSLYGTYRLAKDRPTDFDKDEEAKIQKAVAETLKSKAQERAQ